MSDIIIQKEKFYYSVKLNRVEKSNALTQDMVAELTEFFSTIAKDSYTRAILLTGAGVSFCAGADLEWMRSMAEFSYEENQKDADKLFKMYEAAANCELPIVGYLQGNVFGGGLGLAAICDIAVAEANTKFCFSEVKLGLVPAIISSFVLNKMMPNKARDFMLSGRVFTAEDAYASGLVEFAGRELEAKEYLSATLHCIGLAGPEALRETKNLLNFNRVAKPSEFQKKSIETISKVRVGKEGQEGMKSFFEKRQPGWVWSDPDVE